MTSKTRKPDSKTPGFELSMDEYRKLHERLVEDYGVKSPL